MLASYVLHPGQSHNLTDLCRRYLSGIEALSYKDLNIAKGKTLADIEINLAAYYCGLDCYSTYLLFSKLTAELTQIPDLEQLLQQIELPLEPILAEMEDRGIRIDRDYLAVLSEQLQLDLNLMKLEKLLT
jgi:DNA polymerase-1